MSGSPQAARKFLGSIPSELDLQKKNQVSRDDIEVGGAEKQCILAATEFHNGMKCYLCCQPIFGSIPRKNSLNSRKKLLRDAKAGFLRQQAKVQAVTAASVAAAAASATAAAAEAAAAADPAAAAALAAAAAAAAAAATGAGAAAATAAAAAAADPAAAAAAAVAEAAAAAAAVTDANAKLAEKHALVTKYQDEVDGSAAGTNDLVDPHCWTGGPECEHVIPVFKMALSHGLKTSESKSILELLYKKMTPTQRNKLKVPYENWQRNLMLGLPGTKFTGAALETSCNVGTYMWSHVECNAMKNNDPVINTMLDLNKAEFSVANGRATNDPTAIQSAASASGVDVDNIKEKILNRLLSQDRGAVVHPSAWRKDFGNKVLNDLKVSYADDSRPPPNGCDKAAVLAVLAGVNIPPASTAGAADFNEAAADDRTIPARLSAMPGDQACKDAIYNDLLNQLADCSANNVKGISGNMTKVLNTVAGLRGGGGALVNRNQVGGAKADSTRHVCLSACLFKAAAISASNSSSRIVTIAQFMGLDLGIFTTFAQTAIFGKNVSLDWEAIKGKGVTGMKKALGIFTGGGGAGRNLKGGTKASGAEWKRATKEIIIKKRVLKQWNSFSRMLQAENFEELMLLTEIFDDEEGNEQVRLLLEKAEEKVNHHRANKSDIFSETLALGAQVFWTGPFAITAAKVVPLGTIGILVAINEGVEFPYVVRFPAAYLEKGDLGYSADGQPNNIGMIGADVRTVVPNPASEGGAVDLNPYWNTGMWVQIPIADRESLPEAVVAGAMTDPTALLYATALKESVQELGLYGLMETDMGQLVSHIQEGVDSALEIDDKLMEMVVANAPFGGYLDLIEKQYADFLLQVPHPEFSTFNRLIETIANMMSRSDYNKELFNFLLLFVTVIFWMIVSLEEDIDMRILKINEIGTLVAGAEWAATAAGVEVGRLLGQEEPDDESSFYILARTYVGKKYNEGLSPYLILQSLSLPIVKMNDTDTYTLRATALLAARRRHLPHGLRDDLGAYFVKYLVHFSIKIQESLLQSMYLKTAEELKEYERRGEKILIPLRDPVIDPANPDRWWESPATQVTIQKVNGNRYTVRDPEGDLLELEIEVAQGGGGVEQVGGNNLIVRYSDGYVVSGNFHAEGYDTPFLDPNTLEPPIPPTDKMIYGIESIRRSDPSTDANGSVYFPLPHLEFDQTNIDKNIAEAAARGLEPSELGTYWNFHSGNQWVVETPGYRGGLEVEELLNPSADDRWKENAQKRRRAMLADPRAEAAAEAVDVEVVGGASKRLSYSKKKSLRKKNRKRKTNKKSKKKIIKKSPKYSKRKSIKKKSFKKSSKRNTLRKSKRKSKK